MKRTKKQKSKTRFKVFLCCLCLLVFCFLYIHTYAIHHNSHKIVTTSSSLKKKGKKRINGKKIAIAITVTKDGPYLDGAAVMVQSILNSNSQFDIDLVAIIHPSVQETRSALQNLGFQLREFVEPLKSFEIQGEELRNTIDSSGCRGILELLKLHAYQLTEYHRVLLMDMDTMLLQNIDELFEYNDIDHDLSLQFTWDHAMDSASSKAPPVQGGFLVISPDLAVFQELVNIVKLGDFRRGSGWGGEHIGWCWGGQTIQGLLAYFYSIKRPLEGRVLDDCIYDAMDSVPERCANTPLSKVKSAHFTVCQKPWECHRGRKGFCEHVHSFWWKLRNDLEISQGLEPTKHCCRGCEVRKYTPLKLPLRRTLWPGEL